MSMGEIELVELSRNRDKCLKGHTGHTGNTGRTGHT